MLRKLPTNFICLGVTPNIASLYKAEIFFTESFGDAAREVSMKDKSFLILGSNEETLFPQFSVLENSFRGIVE